MIRRPPRSTPLSLHDALPISGAGNKPENHSSGRPPSLLGRSGVLLEVVPRREDARTVGGDGHGELEMGDRKSTRLNSSHANISYAVFCLKKKKKSRNTSVYLK